MASYSQCAQYVTLLWIQAKTMSSVEDITTHRTKRVVLPACPLPSACHLSCGGRYRTETGASG